MRTQTRYRLVLLAVVLVCGLTGCGVGGQPDEREDDPGREAVTLWTDSVELFFEYPPMVAGQPGEPWAIHLTALGTFRPVTEGTLTLRFEGPDGREHVSVVDAPVRPGIFTPTPTLPTPGLYQLVMELAGPQVSDVISVGPVHVYEAGGQLASSGDNETLRGISFLKEQQWVIPFATVAAIRRAIPRSVMAPGEILPMAGRVAEVTAPVDGLILAESNRSAPAPGQWVRVGQTLAVLSPVGGDNAYAAQRATAERLAREVSRAERLFAAEAIPARRLEEARHELQVARAPLEAIGASPGAGYALALKAPIAGVVNERHLAAGARVAAGDRLFSIVDPRTVWLHLNIPAVHAADASLGSGATFAVEGSARVYRATSVVSVGRVIDPERRTLPVLLEVQNGDQSLKIGMLAEGRLLVGDPVTGVVIPNEAIREEDGIPVAYVQTGGESFERRTLTLGPSDGEWTIVEAGVQFSERVVTLGAYQVRLASLSTSEIADHGHPH